MKTGILEFHSEMKLRRMIIERCGRASQSAIRFNEGAWYIGSHPLDILLEMSTLTSHKVLEN